MLKIDVISIFPDMIESALGFGVLNQALKTGLLAVEAHSPREFAEDRHRTVDDRPFGGGDGMVLLPETLEKTIHKVKHNSSRIIYLSPQGKTLSDKILRQLSQERHLVLICGRYGGIDQRIINKHVDEELSLGDYVLSGGELGALVVIESLSRFIPGVLGHADSSEKDSFSEGLLEHPNFTRPRDFAGESVPEVLLSGNHKLINEWKLRLSEIITLKKRPDLFSLYLSSKVDFEDLKLKDETRKKYLVKIKNFYLNLSQSDREVLGIADMREESFDV